MHKFPGSHPSEIDIQRLRQEGELIGETGWTQVKLLLESKQKEIEAAGLTVDDMKACTAYVDCMMGNYPMEEPAEYKTVVRIPLLNTILDEGVNILRSYGSYRTSLLDFSDVTLRPETQKFLETVTQLQPPDPLKALELFQKAVEDGSILPTDIAPLQKALSLTTGFHSARMLRILDSLLTLEKPPADWKEGVSAVIGEQAVKLRDKLQKLIESN